MATVTACLIVRNEEKALPECLENLKDVVDEIIVLDTGSTDGTIEIAKSYGAKVFHYKWDNHFGRAKNKSFDYATSEWIFSIDADERLSGQLKTNIRKLTEAKESVVYAFPRHDEMLKFVDRKGTGIDRMFRKGTAKYSEDESNAIHEILKYSCQRKFVNCPIIHTQRENHWLVKPTRILSRIALDAERTPKKKSTFYYLVKAAASFWKKFFMLFVIRQGFKNGRKGFKFCIMKGIYGFLKYLFVALKSKNPKIWEDC